MFILQRFILYFSLLMLVIINPNSNLLAKNYAQRIVSLGPYITENLYLLEAGDRIVANTIYCVHPEDAKNKIKIGDVININVEKIYSLKPDLVIYTPLTNPNYVQKLKKLGIRTVFIDQPKNFKEMKKQFIKLAEIIGKKNLAYSIIQKVDPKLNALIKSARKENKPKVFVQIGIKPLFTVTKNSFINDYIEMASGINIARDAKTGIYSREKVVEQNPDIIIITSMGQESEFEKKEWLKFKTINAVRNNNIYLIDEYKLCSPTIVTFLETLEQLIKIFKGKRETN